MDVPQPSRLHGSVGKAHGRAHQIGRHLFQARRHFGHLNTRNFDIEGFKGGEAELNDPKYDLQKIQYLTDSADRLNKIFAAMAAASPDV